jgi:hypothetical protein
MRNLRKLTAVVIAIALVLTSMTAAFAATAPVNADKAATLKALGIYKGTSDTDVSAGLTEDLTVEQSLVYLARIFGYEEAAAKLTADEISTALKSFDDANDISAYAKNVVAYSIKNGFLKGTTKDNKTFSVEPLANVPAARFSTFMLRQMGYDVPEYVKAVAQLSEVKGSKVSATVAGTLTRDIAVGVMYGALTAEKSTGTTVIAGVVGTDAAKLAVAQTAGLVPAPATLAVSDVSAANLKQVKVVFNKEVNSDTIVNGNFAVFTAADTTTDIVSGTSTLSLQSDKKTVLITLDTGKQLSNNSTFEVKVTGVKDTAGNTIADFDKTGISSVDISTPTLVDAKVSGPRTIVATFSEPVYSKASSLAGDFKIDDGSYYIASAVPDTASSTVTLTLGAPLTAGNHTLAVASGTVDLVDYAGYPVISSSKTITSTPVTTAPTAVISAQSQTSVTLKFSAPVDYVSAATIYALYNNVTNGVPTTSVTADTTNGTAYSVNGVNYNDTWILAFKALPAGSNSLYITSSSTTPIADAWGNTFATSVVTLPLNIVLDTTAPTVKSATIALNSAASAHQLTVVWSEDVDGFDTVTNYTLKDSSSTVVAMARNASTSSPTVVFDLNGGNTKLGGGTYTLSIVSLKDKSPALNASTAYTTSIIVKDNVAPTISDVSYISGGSKILVTYSEAVDATAAAKIANYNVVVGGSTLTVSTAQVVDSTHVLLTVSTTLAAAPTVTVINVTDSSGNSISSSFVYAQKEGSVDNGANIVAAKAISTTQVQVEFDRVLTGFSYAGLKVVGTSGPDILIGYPESVTTNSSSHSVVILHLVSELTAAAKNASGSSVSLDVSSGAISATDILGVKAATTTVAISDAIAPTVSTCVYTTTTSITITFTEPLDPASVSAAAGAINGFSLKNGTIGTAKLVDDGVYNKIIITAGKDSSGNQTYFTQDVTTVSYSGTQGLTDKAGNALAAFSDKVAD